ncbi:proline-rich protein 36-like [Dipodomys merriami]|uniref:proline-rich protein 36-like n=1 Tax=Dipodomys merriami TaxID=94247 RepID=UPI00384C6083
MANVLSKVYDELRGLTFSRWVRSSGPEPARCPVCRKVRPGPRPAPPPAGPPRAPKRRCPGPEASDTTPGQGPPASPERSPKRPAPPLPAGDSGLETPRSPSTPSGQLESTPRIATPRPRNHLVVPTMPWDVPLPDSSSDEFEGQEGTQSHGRDIPSSQSSTADNLGENQPPNCSRSQESGKVVEGKKPTASPPPDSQESAKGVDSENTKARPPPDSSQESAKEVVGEKPKTHPPDSQESAKGVVSKNPKDGLPSDSQKSVKMVDSEKPPDSQESKKGVLGEKPKACPPPGYQESGKVVEGKNPTASPPPDSQESEKEVVGEKPKARPPPDSQESAKLVDSEKPKTYPSSDYQKSAKGVVGEKPKACPSADSQMSTKMVDNEKPKAHPPPDSLESVKEVVGETPTARPPASPATPNLAAHRASKRKAALPSALPLPEIVPVPIQWGRGELPLPPKLPCMDMEKDVDICNTTQSTHSKICKTKCSGRTEVTDGSDINTASSVPPPDSQTYVFVTLPTCTLNIPAHLNTTNVEEQAAGANIVPASSSKSNEDLAPKNLISSLTPPADSLTPASQLGVLNDKNGNHAPLMRAATPTTSLSSRLPLPDHSILPCTKESNTATSPDSLPLPFPTLPVVPLPTNTTTTDLAAAAPSSCSNVTLQPATDDEIVHMDTTPPSAAVIFSIPPVSTTDSCALPQAPNSLQQGNFLNGPVPSGPPIPPSQPIPQAPCGLQPGHLLTGPVPTSPPVPQPYPFPQALCSPPQGHVTIGPVPTNSLAPYPHPCPPVPCGLNQGQILNSQVPSSAPIPQVSCNVPQGQLMGPDPTLPPTHHNNPVPQVPGSLFQGQLGMGPAPTNLPPPRVPCPSQPLVHQNDSWTTNAIHVVQPQHTVPHSGTIPSIQVPNNLKSQPMQGPSSRTGHPSNTGALSHPTLGVYNGQPDNLSLRHPAPLPTPTVGLTAPPMQSPSAIIMQTGHMAMTMPFPAVNPPRMPNFSQALVPQNHSGTTNVIPVMQYQHSASVPPYAVPVLPNMGQGIAPVPGSGASPSTDNDNTMDTTPPSEASILPSPPILKTDHFTLNQAPPFPHHGPQRGTISSNQNSINPFAQSQPMQGQGPNTGHQSSTGALSHLTLGVFNGHSGNNFSLSHPATLPISTVSLTATPTQPANYTLMQSGNIGMTAPLTAMNPHMVPYTSKTSVPQSNLWTTNTIAVVQQVCTTASVHPNTGQAIVSIRGSNASQPRKRSVNAGNMMDKKPPSGVSYFPYPPSSHSELNGAPSAFHYMPHSGNISNMQGPFNQLLQSPSMQRPSPSTGHLSTTGALLHHTSGALKGQSNNFSLSYPTAPPTPAIGLSAPPLQPSNYTIMQSGHMTMTAPSSAVNPPRVPNPFQPLVPQKHSWTTNVIQQQQQHIPPYAAPSILPNMGPPIGPIPGYGTSPPTQLSMDNDNMMDTTPPSLASIFPSPVLTNNHFAVNQAHPAAGHMPQSGTISSTQEPNKQYLQTQPMQGPSPNAGYQSSSGALPQPPLGVFNGLQSQPMQGPSPNPGYQSSSGALPHPPLGVFNGLQSQPMQGPIPNPGYQSSSGALPHPSLGVFNGQSDNTFSLSHPVPPPTPAIGLTVSTMQPPPPNTNMQPGHLSMTVPVPAVNPAVTPQNASCSNSQGVVNTSIWKTGKKISRRIVFCDPNSSLNQATPAISATMGNGEPSHTGHLGFKKSTKRSRSKSEAPNNCQKQKFET